MRIRSTARAAAALALFMLPAAALAGGTRPDPPPPQPELLPRVRGLTDDWRAAVPKRLSARPRFPVAGRVGYGEAGARFGVSRPGHAHQGQDVFGAPGAPLRAVSAALVLETGGGDARGNYAVLYDARARRTYVYFHMQGRAAVRAGRRVRAGQRIGRLGCTGRCFGPHLHFEVRRGRGVSGPAVDPLPLLRRWRRLAA